MKHKNFFFFLKDLQFAFQDHTNWQCHFCRMRNDRGQFSFLPLQTEPH